MFLGSDVEPIRDIPGFVYPVTPALSVLVKSQKKFLLMTPMSNVPDAAWTIVSVCSWHKEIS